jgi:pimeloyl-ACP methyl ester carboxylesterase
MKGRIFKVFVLFFFLLITSCNLEEKTLDKVPSDYITVNDSEVHYKVLGEGEKTLVFIHGWGCDLNTWKYQVDYFKDKYRLVLIDLPGYGQSSKVAKNYSITLFAQSILKVITHLNVKKPVLIAHSMGFPIAIEVLKHLNSESVSLCNIDGVYFDFPTDSIENVQYQKDLAGFADMFKGENYTQNVEYFCNGFITENTPDSVKKYILSTMVKTPQEVGYLSMKSLIDKKYWDKEVVHNKIISIYAKIESLSPDNESILRKQFPNMVYRELDSVNHFLMMEKPKKVNKMLNMFIEK